MSTPKDELVPVEQLLPCPFCGYAGFLVEGYQDHELVECGRCSAVGPHDETTSTAENVAAWNTRASLNPTEQGGEG
ncbi:Lar family restriction alleviation protein [Sphingobium sp. B1D7B]|uniref:Lar family restriction alleviation protein n=1 Tax=Sphingobium sp. B1D7B TaxID=2940578 RepID=UPI002224C6E5|nr:Lar family restriction alleviation protein [Sphingobium sp. B1D7B]MCW2405015.1 Lar family restriction alleviation protein [Sphingobium sp. B1D7B]